MFVSAIRTARLMNILKIAFEYKFFMNDLVATCDEIVKTVGAASISALKKTNYLLLCIVLLAIGR